MDAPSNKVGGSGVSVKGKEPMLASGGGEDDDLQARLEQLRKG